MKKHTNIKFSIILLIQIISFQLFAQNEDLLKIENGIKILEENREVSCLSFSTDQNYTKFHNDLLKKFGKPEFEGYTAVFDSLKIKRWAKDPIIIRYEVISVKGFENNWKSITIMAETIQYDLLQPGTKSEKRIRKYLTRNIKRNFE